MSRSKKIVELALAEALCKNNQTVSNAEQENQVELILNDNVKHFTVVENVIIEICTDMPEMEITNNNNIVQNLTLEENTVIESNRDDCDDNIKLKPCSENSNGVITLLEHFPEKLIRTDTDSPKIEITNNNNIITFTYNDNTATESIFSDSGDYNRKLLSYSEHCDTDSLFLHDCSEKSKLADTYLPDIEITKNLYEENTRTDSIISDDSDFNRKLVPYSEHSDSSELLLQDYPKKSKIRRKRSQVNKETWIASKNTKLREQGKNYLGRAKRGEKWEYDIKKNRRLMKRRCSCKETKMGNLKCTSISDVDRQNIFNYFWSLSWGEKKTLIDSIVSTTAVNRPRNRKVSGASRRSQSILYHLRINDNNVRVCREMFLNTLSIGRMTVLDWKTKKNTDTEEKKKSKKEERNKPYHSENEELLNFIQTLPTMESHYCRASSQKKYLLPEWQSKNSLYKFYVNDWCVLKNSSPLSITTFNQVLDIHNIALFNPKKDQCEKCSAYKVGHISVEEFLLHQSKKEDARKEKEYDKINEKFVFTMDLQAVLLAPKSKISSLYYKTKLCVHNMCFYNLGNKDGYCYIWNETEGGVNAEEFATIISRFISEKVLSTIERGNANDEIKIILYSDGCTYQNRNVTVSNALLNIAMKEKIIIEQKYLEVGHTQMEADSMHSTIERCLRNKIINIPAEYYSICREARRNPKKYDVSYLNHTFFKKFDKVNFLKSIRPGKKKGDPKVQDIRALKYTLEGEVYYKLRFGDNWELLPQRQTPGVIYCDFTALEQLHSDRIKIAKRKFEDLQALKHTLADDYHAYYDGIPYE